MAPPTHFGANYANVWAAASATYDKPKRRAGALPNDAASDKLGAGPCAVARGGITATWAPIAQPVQTVVEPAPGFGLEPAPVGDTLIVRKTDSFGNFADPFAPSVAAVTA